MVDREAYAQKKIGPLLEPMVHACIKGRPVDAAGFMVKWLTAKSSGSAEPAVEQAVDGQSREEYGAASVAPLLEPMVAAVLRECPEDPIPKMIEFLAAKASSASGAAPAEKEEAAPAEVEEAREEAAIARTAVRKSLVAVPVVEPEPANPEGTVVAEPVEPAVADKGSPKGKGKGPAADGGGKGKGPVADGGDKGDKGAGKGKGKPKAMTFAEKKEAELRELEEKLSGPAGFAGKDPLSAQEAAVLNEAATDKEEGPYGGRKFLPTRGYFGCKKCGNPLYLPPAKFVH